MSTALVPATQRGFQVKKATALPAIVADADERSRKRFRDFFTVNIRNPNTRAAYFRQVCYLLDWCESRGIRRFRDIEPHTIAAYIELLCRERAEQTAKQALSAIRMLFDWLVVGQVIPLNPASAVRGPSHVVTEGLTPVLDAEQARKLLDSIDTSSIVGLRDRALIAMMCYTFGRVGAVVKMPVRDYFPDGKRWWVRLRREKGGKVIKLPAHHNLEIYLDQYIAAAGIAGDKKGPLFRRAHKNKHNELRKEPLERHYVHAMIKRRAKAAGLPEEISCHTFRATGITTYLKNGGTLERAQYMAGHASARTTKLYDRRNDEVTLDEVERIVI